MATYVSQGQQERPQRAQTTVEGPYNVTITKSNETNSQAGNQMIKLQGEVTESLDGTIKFDDNQGPLVFENLVFTESAAWKIDQYLAARGIKPEEGEEVTIEADDQIGVVVPCYLVEGVTSKGKPCMEISYFIAPDSDSNGDVF